MASNFLALEPELVARLKERLVGQIAPVHVLTSSELTDVIEEKQLTPAVHVMYQGYRPTEKRSDGTVTRVQQVWLVVVATRNTRNLTSGGDARQEAGALAALVSSALMGFQPASASKPLMLAAAPSAAYSGGHQYLPLAFEAEIVLKAG
jgi:phage gp37-like protein